MSNKEIIDNIRQGIGSHMFQMEDRKKAAVQAIMENSFMAAQSAVMEAAYHREIVRELEFQLDVMEVNDVD